MRTAFTALRTILAVGLLASTGCKQETTTMSPPPPTTSTSKSSADDHGHAHTADGGHGVGPHDGTVADWGGGKYHVEFTVDHEKQQATVYIFGSDEKTPAPIDATSIELSIKAPEMQVTLQASPQEGDTASKSSRFVGTHEKLGVVQEYAGTMTGVVDGTPYSGDFKEEAHGDH